MGYTDRVLIKLRRQYSESETVAALSKKVAELEVENGKLISEIHYLEYQGKEDKLTKRDKLENLKKEANTSLKGTQKLRKENVSLKQQRSDLMYQVLMLKQKYENV
jgi:cell division protein FtsB